MFQIKPDDVLEPAYPNKSIVVIECPSLAYLDSLANNSKLHHLSEEQDGVAVVVHFTDGHIMKHATYQKWMQRYCSTSLTLKTVYLKATC